MRRRLILAALAALPVRADAVTPLSPGQVLRGRFVQERHLKGFDAPLRTQGRFVLAANKGLIWQAETPFAITTVITAAGLVQEANGTETMRLPTARLPFLSHLYAMLSGALSGDWHALDPDFTVTRTGDAPHWQADLTPKHPDATGMPFTHITVAGTQFVDQVHMDKPNGDSDQLTFLDQTLSRSPLSPEEGRTLALPKP